MNKPAPQDRSAIIRTAIAYQARGAFDEARKLLLPLQQAHPQAGDVAVALSRLAFEEGDRAECLAQLERALTAAADNPKVWQHAADRYQHFGMTDEALAAWDRAIALEPKAILPRAEKARLQQQAGKFEAANTGFAKLIKAAPREGQLYRIALATKKLARNDPMIAQMVKLWKRDDLREADRMQIGFALAKAMEDTGREDRMFGYLHRANALQQKLAPFDEGAVLRENAAVTAAQEGLGAPEGEAVTPRPVFVTGLPRSGTTLFEQILGAHPQVGAGGELGAALKTAYRLFGTGEEMRAIGDDDLTPFRDRYLRLVRRDVPAGEVVTDKSILCHMIFGLLHAALPGARFIVVHRDPRDVALSMYRNHFALGSHRYATDLAAMAGQMKRFRRNVAHWKARLPGVIAEFRYEDLTADPEGESRRLVQAAGLDWDPAVLDFHKRKGMVKTLSLAQVRAPVHAGRREAWRAHEDELKPFIEAWGDEPWD